MPVRSPEMIEQLGRAYALGTMPARLLAVAFAISTTELSDLVRRHGWKARAEGLWAPGKTPSERAAGIRAAEAARDRELYGDAVDDVRLLRRRGFVVVREGAGFMVGNQQCIRPVRGQGASLHDRGEDGGGLEGPRSATGDSRASAALAFLRELTAMMA
jgi:hypothetical protein